MRSFFRRRLFFVNMLCSALPCSPVAPVLSESMCFAGGHPSVPSDLPLDDRRLLYWRHLDPVVTKFGGSARQVDDSGGGAGSGRLRGFAEAHWKRIESERMSSDHAGGGGDDGVQPGQECDAPFPGLPPAVPWPDESRFPWIQALERGSDAVVSELLDFLASTEGGDRNDQIRSGGELDVAWTPSSTKLCSDTSSFSRLELRDWKGRGTEVGRRHFPRTLRLIRDVVQTPHPHALAPRPVSINRQGPRSGLAPHSDNANFVLVCHLGLVIPSSSEFGAVPCRFVMEGTRTRSRPPARGGDHRQPSSGLFDVAPSYKEWKQGMVVVADTSFVHSTVNDSENEDRFVLHFVVWHPNLTMAERDGIVEMHRALDSFEAECACKGVR